MTIRPDDIIAALTEASIRAALIVPTVGLLLAALRVRAGGVRHAAWTAVLVAMLLLPVLPKWLPEIPVTFIPERGSVAASVVSPSAPPAGVAARRDTPPAPTAGGAEVTTAAPTPVSQVPVARAVHSIDWTAIVVALWAFGALAMLARLGVGWRRAARLAAGSRPVLSDKLVFESDLVATPVTVGVFRPRIVVPVSWGASPDDMREAVLLHERAHIDRRDTLVNLLASVNRSVFWFHPLAWWLERRVSVTAEQACDDHVIRACGSTTRYAELLVAMADAVRVRGERVEWHGVGMAGSGSLAARIDRVLNGRAYSPMSRARKAVVALACATAIVLGVACQRSVPPLRPDPEVAARLASQKALGEKYAAARAMTMEQVTALEAVVAKNPEDLDARERLLVFYSASGQKAMGWNEMVAARRPHLLYMIEHHPESERAMWPMKRSLDPVGYAQARALWMKHVENPDVTAKILGAAAWFFRLSEKPVAEQLLLRAVALDPDGPRPRVVDNTYYSPWTSRLGQLYAQAIVGSDDETLGNVVRSVSLDVANGPFATAAKKTLAASADAAMLRSAGLYLTQNAGRGDGGIVGDQKVSLGFDYRALGESYLDRASALDPNSETTKTFEYYRKLQALDRAQSERRRAILRKPADQVDDPMLAALSESDRFEVLPGLATSAYSNGENSENAKKDRASYEASFARARDLADQTLALADEFKADPRYGPSQFSAHVTRGLVALRGGDRRLAVAHMRAAIDGLKADDVLTSWDTMLHARLGNYLLNWGERGSVAAFWEHLARFLGPRGQGLADAAKAIREGRMPEAYQYAVTPH